MEEIEFQEWLTDLEKIEVTYSVVYNPDNMKILKVGPSHALVNEDNCITVNTDIAERILSGEVNINSCFLDLDNGEIGVTETKSLTKIDDVLHRIASKKWSKAERLDIYMKLNTDQTEITVQLGSQWGGTYINSDSDLQEDRKIQWSGDTQLEFLITDYNDPNIIYDFFNFSIEKLIKSNYTKKIYMPNSNVSVYTRRIFKNYVVEYV